MAVPTDKYGPALAHNIKVIVSLKIKIKISHGCSYR
jgi:hypothetical protein